MYRNLKEASYLRFSSCESCERRCCDGGQFVIAPLILEDIKEVYRDFLVAIAIINHKLRFVMLISNRHKPCLYYENSRCQIYESRPPACKIYPIAPYYDEILVDTTCHAVGSEGALLSNGEGVNESFYHQRLEGFSEKVQRCERFLSQLDWNFRPIYEIDGIALLEYTGVQRNSFIQMHRASLRFLKEWV